MFAQAVLVCVKNDKTIKKCAAFRCIICLFFPHNLVNPIPQFVSPLPPNGNGPGGYQDHTRGYKSKHNAALVYFQHKLVTFMKLSLEMANCLGIDDLSCARV